MGWSFTRGSRGCSCVLLLLVLVGAASPQEVEQAKAEATAALVQVLKLWNVEDYGAVYDRGTTTTKRLFTREDFIGRMRGLGCKTTCCWTTFELHNADYQSPRLVVVAGRVGFEWTGRIVPRFQCGPRVQSFPMTREEEAWRIDLTLILPFF
ncbi:MAG: hypothetical protein V3R58_01400 [candidate division NC10 bacterium]